ncbi:hypothetical protein Q7P37_001661 [Cladosporium fusiforme]
MAQQQPTSRRDRPWLLPYNRRLRNLHSISLRNLSLNVSPSSRPRGKTIDDDAVPNTLVSPAKLVALRENKTLGHSRSSSDLRRVLEDGSQSDVDRTEAEEGSPKKEPAPKAHDTGNGTPRTPPRPSFARLRRRSTLEWANASPQSRQERLEGMTSERMADVFFSLHVPGVDEPIYVSEVVEHTMNPTFRSIDLEVTAPGTTRLDQLTVRVWTKSAKWHAWRQLLDVSLNLRELQFLGKHLESIERRLPQNAIVFHISDGVYTTFNSVAEYTPPMPAAPLGRANSTRVSPTSSFDALLRLSKLDDSIQDALATRNKIAADLESILQENNLAIVDRDSVAEAGDRLKTIEYAKRTVSKQLDKARAQQAEKRTSLANRRDLMSKDTTQNDRQAEEMRDGRADTPETRSHLEQGKKDIQNQRRRICEDLQKVYPIHPIKNKTLAFTIRGLPLPNSEDVDASPPETIAAALGHVAHVLQLLSFYLGHPLAYPVNPRSSTSTVYDPISLLPSEARKATSADGEKMLRTYPLFSRGVPRFRFEYALFLLNKNIQLLLETHFGVRVLDIRHTLPNLKYLLYVATAGEGELPARKAGGVRGLMRGGARGVTSRTASSDSASSLSGLLWHGTKQPEDGKGQGAVESLKRNAGALDRRGKAG